MKGISSFAFILLVLSSAAIINGCSSSSSPASMIAVSVSVSNTPLEATGASSVTATVIGDTSGMGVTWSVSCSAAPCGSVVPGPAGGTPNTYTGTYTAPTTPPPNDLTVTVKATSLADGSKSGSATVTISAITLSVSPTTATVQGVAGNTVPMNVGVNNDPSNQGVTFTISPSSQAANLSIQSPFSATYTAPTTPPASDLTVTVTATSIEDSTKTTNVIITVPSVTIAVTPITATVDATGTVPNIVATVGNDPSNKGVTWAVSCSPTPCGSIPTGPTLSGSPTTYTAPTTPPSPSDLSVTVTATAVADPAAQTSITVTVKAISVVVTAPMSTVQFNQTVSNIVAVVNDDPAMKGVTWAIQPCGVTDCGSISPNATASGGAVTYTAPAAPPASNLVVTITATSDSDPNQQGSVQITVLAIVVSVSPPSAMIPVNATAALNATPFTATVSNDSSNQGVNWTLTQGGTACSPACGIITPANTASGTPTTYAAPSTVPTNAMVIITATSVTDGTKSVGPTITLTAGTVKLIPTDLKFGGLKITPTNPHPTKTLPETLTNTGSSALSITSQTITGTGPFSIPTTPSSGFCQGNSATTLASGGSCTISVMFAPTSTGSFSGTLSITDNDTTSPQLVALSGQGCGRTIRCLGEAAIRAALAENPTPVVPSPTGSFRVGTRTVDLVDAKRPDPYLANGAKRELLVRFWYPSAVGRSCQPAEYASAGVWSYLAQLEKVPAPQVKTNSCQDASVATGPHPVVVFTHGYTGTFTDYTFLFEELASRGYIVASVDHTFEATAVQFPDGRLLKSVLGSRVDNTLRMDEQAISLAVAARLTDLKFVMDQLQLLNASRTGPFAGTLDLSHVALAGHSLGGLTALLGLKLEPRFAAAISMDGVVPSPLFGATEKPVLLLFAGRDAWDQNTCQLWSGLHGPRLALNFKGSEHLTPSDAVWLANGAILTGTVGMENTVAGIRNYIAAFLETNLRGNPADSLLKGPSSDYPDVEVTTQGQSPCARSGKNVQN
jgi:dienelactone hydrolase